MKPICATCDHWGNPGGGKLIRRCRIKKNNTGHVFFCDIGRWAAVGESDPGGAIPTVQIADSAYVKVHPRRQIRRESEIPGGDPPGNPVREIPGGERHAASDRGPDARPAKPTPDKDLRHKVASQEAVRQELNERKGIFVARFRLACKTHGIKVRRMAEISGLNEQSISRLLRGVVFPNVVTLVLLAGAFQRLGVDYATPDYLLGYKNAQENESLEAKS